MLLPWLGSGVGQIGHWHKAMCAEHTCSKVSVLRPKPGVVSRGRHQKRLVSHPSGHHGGESGKKLDQSAGQQTVHMYEMVDTQATSGWCLAGSNPPARQYAHSSMRSVQVSNLVASVNRRHEAAPRSERGRSERAGARLPMPDVRKTLLSARCTGGAARRQGPLHAAGARNRPLRLGQNRFRGTDAKSRYRRPPTCHVLAVEPGSEPVFHPPNGYGQVVRRSLFAQTFL